MLLEMKHNYEPAFEYIMLLGFNMLLEIEHIVST